jgi:hypothetical protein
MSEENKTVEPEQPAENIPEEIISQTEIFLPGTEEQPLTDSNDHMEVHHHTHAAHGKKNWKAYFWEFLMLFLAVFCGFLAEYQLEHIIEHQREKQYMSSMLNDLSADTAIVNSAIPSKEARINAIDSVFIFFKTNPEVKTISGKIFKMIRRTNYDIRFIRNNITLNQLKNAGGMRLVRKKQVADSISRYDFYCESVISLYNEYYLANGQLGARQFEKLFVAADLLSLYIDNNTGRIVANIRDSITIRINTDELNEQLNFMMQEKAYAKQEIDRYNSVKERAVRLIELIKKEYKFD